MDEPYDWAKEDEELHYGQVTRPAPPSVPAIRVSYHPQERQAPYYYPQEYRSHGPGCRCRDCDPRPLPVANQGAPLLDKVVALVVAFTALILGSVLLAPLMVAMLGMVALIMIVVVAALAILMGIVWAIVGYRRGPDDHLPMRRR